MEYISQKLIDLIEHNANELVLNLIKNLKQSKETPTYHQFSEVELKDRVFNVYSNLSKWISRDTSKEEIEAIYKQLGKTRYNEGFALSEVLQALILTRRHLWLKVLSEGYLDTALDLHQALQLNNRVVLFFDRAMYFTAVGYQEASMNQ